MSNQGTDRVKILQNLISPENKHGGGFGFSDSMTEAERYFNDFQNKKDVNGLVKTMEGLEKGNKEKWNALLFVV